MKKIILLNLLLILLSCTKENEIINSNNENPYTNQISDEDFAQINFGDAITTNFIGKITDSEKRQLKDVIISIGNQSTSTDEFGVFVLNNVSVFEKFAFVKAERNGYLSGSRTIVPIANGTNDVQIQLLEKNIIGSVNSGNKSSVSLPNGSKVEFQGDFIDSSGNVYLGQVDVSLNYLQPNQNELFEQMPGSLFGKKEDGYPSTMETYGMLGVNLFSPSGEELNIAQESLATLTFPVDVSTPNTPTEIPLWYFDELQGFWKEQGKVTKQGNIYIAEVTHFTWWTWGIPLNDSIKLCFSLESSNGSDISNNYIKIIRNSRQQALFFGYTNAFGEECGLVPKNEQFTLKVYSDCFTSTIYEQILGGYSSDTNEKIIVDEISDIKHTTIKGTVLDCDGNTITNGYALIAVNNKTEIVPMISPDFEYDLTYCSNPNLSIIFLDNNAQKRTDILNLNIIDNGITHLSQINICNQKGGIYAGNLRLSTQQEIDDFGKFGYTEINGYLYLGDPNYVNQISNFSSLNSLQRINGDFSISCEIPTLIGLNNIENIEGNLFIESRYGLTNLNGLESLTSIKGNFTMDYNPSLQTFSGLNNLNSIGGDILISRNSSFTNLTGLDNVSSIGGNLTIRGNNGLNSLNGLQKLLDVKNIYIGLDKNGEYASYGNANLNDFCALTNLVTNGSHGVLKTLNNAYNPTNQDIINGNCKQ